MNGSVDDDPFDSIVPGAAENVFRRCPFAGKRKSRDSDSEASNVEFTDIFMLSMSDSSEDQDDCTPPMYHTAPEELVDDIGAEVSVKYVDHGEAIDLGRDTNVEVQSTAEISEKDKSIEIISVCRIHGSQAKKSALPFDESVVSLGESSSKKLRLSEEALGSSSCAETVVDKFPVYSTNSGGGSESSGRISNLKGKSEVKESVEHSQSHQLRKLQEEAANCHQSCFHVLPSSISGVKGNVAGKKKELTMEVIVLEILKILTGEQEIEIDDDDESLSKLSILDIVQSRGMTFPRPEWWPPEY